MLLQFFPAYSDPFLIFFFFLNLTLAFFICQDYYSLNLPDFCECLFFPSGYGLAVWFDIHCLYLTCWKAVVYTISILKDSNQQFLQPQCTIITLDCCFAKCTFVTANVISWKSENPVSTRLVIVKDLGLLVKIKSIYAHKSWLNMVLVLSKAIHQISDVITLKSIHITCPGSKLKSPFTLKFSYLDERISILTVFPVGTCQLRRL